MSQDFNQPSSQQPTENSSQPPRKNTVVYWVIIGILLVACIILFVQKNKTANEKAQTEEQLATSDSSRKAVETDYNAALARLDQLVSKNAEMDSTINSKNGEIAKLKDQINHILGDSRANASDLKKARDLIARLNTRVKSYEERIAELEGENQDLSNKNEVLAQERDSTVTRNIALKTVGSVLHASNIRMNPIHLMKGGKKESTTEHARKVDMLRIVFDIDENRIAESGTKQVQLKITGPDGIPFSDPAFGSGSINLANGQNVNYTLVKDIPLQQGQPVKDVTVDWHQVTDYKAGAYNIEIYNGGYKIGSGSVTLKK
ncbi:MAG: hypothetical protein BGO69_10500 [Bacteroidetes bacterium 46-16]|nr:MAG: hypothetical protein BGO69_10500 [Bacteroidetes bacterium 46-16]